MTPQDIRLFLAMGLLTRSQYAQQIKVVSHQFCKRCGHLKARAEFSRHVHTRTGLQGVCKQCMSLACRKK